MGAAVLAGTYFFLPEKIFFWISGGHLQTTYIRELNCPEEPGLAMGTPDIQAIGRWGVGVGNIL